MSSTGDSSPQVSPESKPSTAHPPPPRSSRSLVDLQEAHGHHKPNVALLTLAALGVVYGDIGTSPLYALKECLLSAHSPTSLGSDGLVDMALAQLNLYGVLSLVFWSLAMVVSFKYLTFIMKADNHGEGGILALLALVPEQLRQGHGKRKVGWVAGLVIIGASLLYGDGMITPAISVLSAMEGLEVPSQVSEAAGHGASPYGHLVKQAVVPLTCVVLVALFMIQRRGTSSVGKYFGPIMLLWFGALGGIGIFHLTKNPSILKVVSPLYAVDYFRHHGWHGFKVLGSVVLAVTGGEALYADMGHFGAKPIRRGWWFIAMPALVLNYFGQGALVLSDPSVLAIKNFNPFFYTVVPWGMPAVYALVLIATLATIIASQALITGAYSLTSQAIQLGYFPRVTVRHTSHEAEGQIYLPQINWLLMIVCVLLVITMRESAKLAAAYGIAVTGTMAITTIVFYVVARETWKWPLWKAGGLALLFLCFDVPFLVANALKFFEGGYIPIFIGLAFFLVMYTWRTGRALLGEHINERSPHMDKFLSELDGKLLARIPGTGVFMASNSSRVPPVLFHHAERMRILHENVLLLTVSVEHVPNVPPEKRLKIQTIGSGFCRIIARSGFMDAPNVPELIQQALEIIARQTGCAKIDPNNITYYLGRETFVATGKGKMGKWSETLFAYLSRNAQPATMYFNIPPDQVVELGTQIDL